jgi:excisionase family DNA binding protein
MSEYARDPAALLSADQVAARLGCKIRLVRKLSAERRIPVVKVGRLTRFKPSDVESYIESNTVRGIT